MQATASIINLVTGKEQLLQELLEELKTQGYELSEVSLTKMGVGSEAMQKRACKNGFFAITNQIFREEEQWTLRVRVYQELDGSWNLTHELWQGSFST